MPAHLGQPENVTVKFHRLGQVINPVPCVKESFYLLHAVSLPEPPPICDPPFAIRHLPSAICHRPFEISDLKFQILDQVGSGKPPMNTWPTARPQTRGTASLFQKPLLK